MSIKSSTRQIPIHTFLSVAFYCTGNDLLTALHINKKFGALAHLIQHINCSMLTPPQLTHFPSVTSIEIHFNHLRKFTKVISGKSIHVHSDDTDPELIPLSLRNNITALYNVTCPQGLASFPNLNTLTVVLTEETLETFLPFCADPVICKALWRVTIVSVCLNMQLIEAINQITKQLVLVFKDDCYSQDISSEELSTLSKLNPLFKCFIQSRHPTVKLLNSTIQMLPLTDANSRISRFTISSNTFFHHQFIEYYNQHLFCIDTCRVVGIIGERSATDSVVDCSLFQVNKLVLHNVEVAVSIRITLPLTCRTLVTHNTRNVHFEYCENHSLNVLKIVADKSSTLLLPSTLHDLILRDCHSLLELPNITQLSQLTFLELAHNECLHPLNIPTSIRKLSLTGSELFTKLTIDYTTPHIVELSLSEFTHEIAKIISPQTLTMLQLTRCEMCVVDLPQLRQLSIRDGQCTIDGSLPLLTFMQVDVSDASHLQHLLQSVINLPVLELQVSSKLKTFDAIAFDIPNCMTFIEYDCSNSILYSIANLKSCQLKVVSSTTIESSPGSLTLPTSLQWLNVVNMDNVMISNLMELIELPQWQQKYLISIQVENQKKLEKQKVNEERRKKSEDKEPSQQSSK